MIFGWRCRRDSLPKFKMALQNRDPTERLNIQRPIGQQELIGSITKQSD